MYKHILVTILAGLSFLSTAVFAATDVNKATLAELDALKGVGPALSARLLDARKTGEFKNWGDLVDRVKGIGPGNARRLSEAGMTVNGKAYAGEGAPADKAAKPTTPATPATPAKAPAPAAAKPRTAS